MADEQPPAPERAQPERVAAFDAMGEKVMVPTSDLGQLQAMGGRAATPDEIAQGKLQEEYDKRSTASKAAGLVTGGTIGALPPQLEAWRAGGGAGLSADMEAAITHEAIKRIGGDKAAKDYAKHQEDLRKAYSGTYTAGEIGGVAASMLLPVGGAAKGAGGLAKAARLVPSVAIGEAGALAEQVAARGAAKLGGGALARAAATGVKMAARAGVEGALYGASHEVSEELLGDKPVAAEKILTAAGMGGALGMAAGGILGGSGSLLASGAKRAGGGLVRALGRGESAVARLSSGATEAAAKEEGGILSRALSKDSLLEHADEQAYRALGGTKRDATRIAKTNITDRDVGKFVREELLLDGKAASEVGTVGSAMQNRADELLPRAVTKKAEIGAGIGEQVGKYNSIMDMAPVYKMADDIIEKLSVDTHTIGAGRELAQAVDHMKTALTNRTGSPIASDLETIFRQRSKMESMVYEQNRSSASRDALKTWLRDIDTHVLEGLEKNAAEAGEPGAIDRIKGLKRRYQLASEAVKTLEHGADRVAGNNMVPLRAGAAAATALAFGHPIGGALMGIGGKLVQDRGHAAAAVLLSKAAELGGLAKMVAHVDGLVGKAAKGAVVPVRASARPMNRATAIAKATQMAERVREASRDPYRTSARIAEHIAPAARVAPETASHMTAAATRALGWLSSQVPPEPDGDLLRTGKRPMSEAAARDFLRAAGYVATPAKILEDFASGKYDRKTIEAAKVVMPEVFSELQRRTLANIVDHQARGKPIPYMQRVKLSSMLDIPGDWTVEPDALAMLQSNASAAPEPGQNGAKGRPAKHSGRAGDITKPSTLDRIESR